MSFLDYLKDGLRNLGRGSRFGREEVEDQPEHSIADGVRTPPTGTVSDSVRNTIRTGFRANEGSRHLDLNGERYHRPPSITDAPRAAGRAPSGRLFEDYPSSLDPNRMGFGASSVSSLSSEASLSGALPLAPAETADTSRAEGAGLTGSIFPAPDQAEIPANPLFPERHDDKSGPLF